LLLDGVKEEGSSEEACRRGDGDGEEDVTGTGALFAKGEFEDEGL